MLELWPGNQSGRPKDSSGRTAASARGGVTRPPGYPRVLLCWEAIISNETASAMKPHRKISLEKSPLSVNNQLPVVPTITAQAPQIVADNYGDPVSKLMG